MIKSRLVIPRRWRCLLCGRTLVSSYPAFCTDHSTLDFPANCTTENMVRLCGYSECDVPATRRLTCGDHHDVLAAREALRWTVTPSAEQKGDWLFRERVRSGCSRSKLAGLLRVHWNYLFRTEVKDLWLPAEWIELVNRTLERGQHHRQLDPPGWKRMDKGGIGASPRLSRAACDEEGTRNPPKLKEGNPWKK